MPCAFDTSRFQICQMNGEMVLLDHNHGYDLLYHVQCLSTYSQTGNINSPPITIGRRGALWCPTLPCLFYTYTHIRMPIHFYLMHVCSCISHYNLTFSFAHQIIVKVQRTKPSSRTQRNCSPTMFGRLNSFTLVPMTTINLVLLLYAHFTYILRIHTLLRTHTYSHAYIHICLMAWLIL